MKLKDVIQMVEGEIKTLDRLCDTSENQIKSKIIQIRVTRPNVIAEVISLRENLARKSALESVLELLEDVK